MAGAGGEGHDVASETFLVFLFCVHYICVVFKNIIKLNRFSIIIAYKLDLKC